MKQTNRNGVFEMEKVNRSFIEPLGEAQLKEAKEGAINWFHTGTGENGSNILK